MIETTNTNELQGQMDLGDLMGAEPEAPEGYDENGHLLDYAPGEATISTADAQSSRGGDAPPAPVIPSEVEGSSTDRLTALAVEINAITEQTRGVVISAACAVGKRLIEAKGLCPEGRWTEWLAKSVNYSERKAQDMMRLYAEYGRDGQIPESIAALDYSKAVALLSAPAEAREGLAVRANDEDLSVRQLQAEIKALKEEAAKAQTEIEWHEHMKERLDHNINDVENERDEAEKQLEAKEAELQQTRAVVAEAAEKIAAANAKADAAESAAAELRRLHSDAEDRAAANAQRASDAVNRANQTAKDLAQARAEIARLREQGTGNREQGTGNREQEPEERVVEVVPEAVTRELEDLRAQLAEAKAAAAGTSSDCLRQPPSPEGKASAIEKFKWFYANQMKPAFATALELLREVAREDGHAADMFATALSNGCKQLMGQLGEKK